MQVPTKRFAILLAATAAATCALAALLLFMSATAIAPAHAAMPATAGDWFITANSTGSNVYIGNTIYDRLYGPFGNMFGSNGGGLFDMPVAPDGKTALVSNFGDGAVYFIDVTDPSQPAIDLTRPISVDIGFFAEDIAITTDSKYALVTDGGFSSRIATIDLLTHRLVFTHELEGGRYANAVDVGPDGTVIVADYFAYTGTLHTLLIDDNGQLTYAHTYSYWNNADADPPEIGRAVNVAIAPDGQTVIVCDAVTTAVPIYQVTSPGVLSWQGLTEPLAHNPIIRPALRSVEQPGPGRIVETGIDAAAISGPGIQSVAFRTDGQQAYVVINNRRDENVDPLFNQVGVLDITGPGEVRVSDDALVTLPTSSGSQLFGVDVIAVAGHKAYVGQPTLSIVTGTNILSVVNLDTYEVFTHEIEGIATGVSTIPLNNYRLPLIQRD